MAAFYRENIADIELQSGSIFREWVGYSIGLKDKAANRFGIRVFRNGEPVNLEGYTCEGFFQNSRKANISLSSYGRISGNTAYVTLPQACYDYEGQFTLAIKVVNESATVTMRIVDGMVDNTYTGGAAAPTGSVPTYQEVLAVYDQMVAAKNGSVRFDITQELTTSQQTKARTNIEAAKESDVTNLRASALNTKYANASALPKGITDLNDLTDPGNYRIGTTSKAQNTANTPVDEPGRIAVMTLYNTTPIFQVYITSKGIIYTRYYSGGTWKKWNQCGFKEDTELIRKATYTINEDILLTGTDTDNGYMADKYYNINTGNFVDTVTGVGFVSEYFEVVPGQQVTMNYNLKSNTYGHVILDENKNIIGSVPANENNMVFIIEQEKARYIQFMGNQEKKYTYRVQILIPSLAQVMKNRYDIDHIFPVYYEDPVKYFISDFGYQPVLDPGDNYRDYGVAFNVKTWEIDKWTKTEQLKANAKGKFLTDIIPVESGQKIELDFDISSSTYGHAFYNDQNEVVSVIESEVTKHEFIVPDGATGIRLTGVANRRNLYQMLVSDPIETPDGTILSGNGTRKALKRTCDTFSYNGTEYNHVAFPSMCYFAGIKVIAFRFSKSHETPVSSENWGGSQLVTVENGEMKPLLTLTAEKFTGLDGEIRDTQIQPTPDGEYLIIATWTTYKEDNVTKHDNLLVCVDQDFNIVDYKIDKFDDEAGYMFLYWGNPIISPAGYLMVAGYRSDKGACVYRSTEAFNGSVSGLTMEKTIAYDTETVHTDYLVAENCIGYWNGNLIMISRRSNRDGTMANAILLQADDPDDPEEWETPIDLGYCIHAPKVFPAWFGNYLPFFGARCIKIPTDRYPIFGYVDMVSNTHPVMIGRVDPQLPRNYGGYIGTVRINENEFDTVYYEETVKSLSSLSGSTGLYMKKINAFELIPGMIYKI